MIVTAKCTIDAFDSKTAQYFVRGETIEGFDTDSEMGKRLSSLTTARGEWVFQWPGRETPKAADAMKAIPVPIQPAAPGKPKGMSAEHKKKLAQARKVAMEARAKAREERANRGQEQATT
jgi:hypothetical protein